MGDDAIEIVAGVCARLFGGYLVDSQWLAWCEANDCSEVLVRPLLTFTAAIDSDREILLHRTLKDDYRWLRDILSNCNPEKNDRSRWCWCQTRESIKNDSEACVLANATTVEQWKKEKGAFQDNLKTARRNMDKKEEARLKELLKQHRGVPCTPSEFLDRVTRYV